MAKDPISVARSQIGFALFGPYVELEPGDYEVDFEFHAASSVSPSSREYVCKSGSAFVSLGGINVVVRHREDFQIISEVLVFNTYSILPLRDSIVIDVGMNIGLASVFSPSSDGPRKSTDSNPFAIRSRAPRKRSTATIS